MNTRWKSRENEADELEELEDEVNGESILGIEEAEDWE